MLLAVSPRQLAPLAAALALAPALAWADHPAGVFGPGAGGPVLTPTADVLPQGNWSIALYNEYRRFDVPSRAALEAQAAEAGHVHSLRYLWSPSVGIAYGLSDQLTLAARLPYVKRADLAEGHVHGGHVGVHELGDSAGLGDLSLTGYWRFWDNGDGGAAALSFGSFLPTGSTDEVDAEGDRFATEHQPGSGAWRPFVGAIYSHNMNRLGLHANARYTWATEGAQQTELGDRLDYGLALSYRLTKAAEEPHHHHHGDAAQPHHHHEEPAAPLQWDLLLELSGEYQRPQRIAGVTEGHDEHILFLAPGLRVSGNGGWTVAASVGFPVYQDIGHEHIETDWRALASLGYSF
jgi:hypothetical protein